MNDKMNKIKDFQESFNDTEYTGIFGAIESVGGLDLFTTEMAGYLDSLYKLERGNKWCSPVANDVMEAGGEFDHTTIAKTILELYTVQWHKYLAYLKAEYNPVENYDRYSDITVKGSNSSSGTNNTTEKTSAFNSQDLKETGKTENTNGSSGSSENKTEEHEHGRIGYREEVASASSLMEADSKFWLKFNYYKILFDDVDRVLALSTY